MVSIRSYDQSEITSSQRRMMATADKFKAIYYDPIIVEKATSVNDKGIGNEFLM